MSQLYGGRTAQELATADALATRDWELDIAHGMVFVNNPSEAVARFDLAFSQRALEDATVAVMARNALPDLLARLRAAEEAREKVEAAITEWYEATTSDDTNFSKPSRVQTDGRRRIQRAEDTLDEIARSLLAAREGRGDEA